jgi:hypothetical protein
MPNKYNSNNQLTEKVSDNIFVNSVLRRTETNFEMDDCFNYSYVKISYYSTVNTTLKITFHPSLLPCQLFGTQQNIQTNSLLNITLNTTSYICAASTYKYFVLAVRGEMMTLQINVDTPSHLPNDRHTYLRVMFSNHNNFPQNE